MVFYFFPEALLKKRLHIRLEHVLVAGVDYSWNRVHKTGGFGYEYIDLYDIDYSAISDFGDFSKLIGFEKVWAFDDKYRSLEQKS